MDENLMRIVGQYPFNDPEHIVEQNYARELAEVKSVIQSIDAQQHRSKVSAEKTMPGRMLYSPVSLNKNFSEAFANLDWHKQRVRCNYPTEYYIDGYTPPDLTHGAFREMDFIKNKVGVEIQFGKYSFMVYNVAAKMTIFRNLGHITVGIEIVPVKEFASQMSTGVSYFEQFLWDLDQRGTSNIDVPVLVIGITA